MKLSRKEMVVAAVSAAAAVAAILIGSTRWSLVVIDGLLLMLLALGMVAFRRQTSSQAGQLERIERKIDNLALRVVTESQATHRELGGLIEELGTLLRDRDRDESA